MRAQASAQQKADEIKTQAARGKDEAATGWQTMKDRWQSHVTDLHDKATDKKAEMDRNKGEIRAEAAEDYADDAINFAIAAVQEAEYAVLDAVLARSDADALAGAPANTPAQVWPLTPPGRALSRDCPASWAVKLGKKVSMVEVANIREWRGHDVVDADDHKIGKLEAIYVDTATDLPSFATVTVGMPGRQRLVFVPLDRATVGPGYLRVFYGRKLVRDAPSIEVDGELPAADEEAVFKHYGLAYQPGAGGERRLARR